MSYLVLARKFRPQSFSEVAGQEHVTRTLANSIKRSKIAHAYLFAGPRGVGKTSIARIFSKSLNCTKGPTLEPCLKCTNCIEIAQGSNLAVREIDGASHNSVDNVRDLIDSFRSLPHPGSRFKVYIIDEVHMLSGSAFNALLKSLEEPPPHTVFILATTEAHKIPETVISRCQRHDFRALTHEQIEERLRHVAESEGMKIEAEVIRMIARLSEGSLRDGESLLERVAAFCEGAITAKETSQVLGTVERAALLRLSQAVFAREATSALEHLQNTLSLGVDTTIFLKEFASHWRELLIARFGGERELQKLGISGQDSVELMRQVQGVSPQDLQDLVHMAREGADKALWSRYPRYMLEALLVRMATRESVHQLSPLIQDLKRALTDRVVTDRVVTERATSDRPPTDRGQAPGKAPNTSNALSKSAPAQATPPLEWGAFVQEVLNKYSKMLGEQLKRLAVEVFGDGTLKARGPDFSVAYILEQDNRKKLDQALREITKCEVWNVHITAAQNGGEQTLHSKEEEDRAQKGKERKRDLSNHPKIKSLQKAFPGSKIEAIKLKEAD